MFRSGPPPTPKKFAGGPVTIGTTAVELTFTDKTKAIHVQSDHDNSGELYFGDSTVESDGSNAMMRLDAGEGMGIDLDDENAPTYVVASAAGHTAYKLALSL